MIKEYSILKRIYKKFQSFSKKDFFASAKKFSADLESIKISDKILNQIFESYDKDHFFLFLKKIKDIIYSEKIYFFLLKNFEEDWSLWRYIAFLKKENLVSFDRKGKVKYVNSVLLKSLPRPQTEKEIKKKLEKKLKIKIKKEDFVFNLFKKDFSFFPEKEFDQLPISQGSAIFIVSKILEYLPLYQTFLFVGDDDFISIILSLVDPKIKSLVCDLDERILKNIQSLAKKYNLKIKTKKIDIFKRKKLKGNFVGFLTSPVYTEEGVKMFVKFGKEQLGRDGGFGFLNLGDEIIGNRILFLQKFFTDENLIIEEKINGKISYPRIRLYEEDEEIERRFSLFFTKRIIEKIPKIGSTLYIFEYLPFKLKRIKFKKSPYAYL